MTSANSQQTRTIYPQVVMSTNNFFAMHQAVKRGVGFGVLPYWFIEKDLANGSLVQVAPEWEPRSLPICASYLPSGFCLQRIGAFVDYLSYKLIDIPGIRTIPNQKVASIL